MSKETQATSRVVGTRELAERIAEEAATRAELA